VVDPLLFDKKIVVEEKYPHSNYRQNDNREKWGRMGLNGFIHKELNKNYIKEKKKIL
jgi:hypothetical protein